MPEHPRCPSRGTHRCGRDAALGLGVAGMLRSPAPVPPWRYVTQEGGPSSSRLSERFVSASGLPASL